MRGEGVSGGDGEGRRGRYAGFSGAAVADANEFGDVVPWLSHGWKAGKVDLGKGLSMLIARGVNTRRGGSRGWE